MTPAQARFLKRLIVEDRHRVHIMNCSPGESYAYCHELGYWPRGEVEVGQINGVDPRTADTFERLGLITMTNNENGQVVAKLREDMSHV